MSEARATKSFNVHAAVYAVVRQGVWDPDDIAERVATEVPIQFLRAALREVLRDVARIELTRLRSAVIARNIDEPTEKLAQSDGSSGRRYDAFDFPIPLPGGWSRLTAMTVEECLALAKDYQANADANAWRAEKLRATASAMKRSGVKTAGKLGDRLKEIWK